jgi:hypothetical protein
MCSFPNCLLFLICDFQYCCRSRTTGGSYAAPSERLACRPKPQANPAREAGSSREPLQRSAS